MIFTLDDFPDCPEVVEDRETFEGNAVKKAVAVMTCTGKAAVSDDSGLEVYALGNAPGVLSARYAGEPASDEANIRRVLSELVAIPPEQRGARFVCYISLAMPGAEVRSFCGTVEGRIGTEPRGAGGFGYDPVFYPYGFDQTFAEMSPDEKDALSHRRQALELLKEWLTVIEK
jgi:XTP/dITP diphosphohydrolase